MSIEERYGSVFLGSLTLPCGLLALLSGCGGGNSITLGTDVPNISISPRPTSIAVNSTTTFAAKITGAAPVSPITWSFLPSDNAEFGSFSNESDTSVTYTAPSTPPVYLTDFNPADQGKVEIQAAVEGAFGAGLSRQSFIVTAPEITTGISPSSVTIPLGTKVSFLGYAVGNTNNAVLFQVNGVTSGSTTCGVIDDMGNYTAPSTMPITGSKVTITVVSQADPSKSSSATVTLQ